MFSRALILIGLILAATACSSPEKIGTNHPASLQRIVAVYERSVAAALNDPEVEWVHGWDGNDRIAEATAENLKGLCYEWQELVYAAVQRPSRAENWTASMITINEDYFSEHHAVLVHPAALGSPEAVLEERSDEAWVLDPWVEGKADVFRLKDWLAIPWIVFEAASIETPPSR